MPGIKPHNLSYLTPQHLLVQVVYHGWESLGVQKHGSPSREVRPEKVHIIPNLCSYLCSLHMLLHHFLMKVVGDRWALGYGNLDPFRLHPGMLHYIYDP
ncbi:hypothetical protein ES703_124692 [subsurface metagenome]